MKKDLIFFGKGEGIIALTSTSANHIANMAKEYIQTLEKTLSNIRFYKEEMQLISGGSKHTLKEGIIETQLLKVPKMIADISKAKSLIAWLREAIKARQNLVAEVSGLSIEDVYKMLGGTMPIAPERPDVLTEDEYYGSLPIKERNRYYELETSAAVLGKYIHPDGVYAKAREELKEVSSNPHTVVGSGRDALIYSYTPTVSIDEVEQQFFQLQKLHRETQAALNSIKFKCWKAIEESAIKANSQYEAEYTVYTSEIKAITAKVRKWKEMKIQEIGDLRIIIPNTLLDIYMVISSLGKQ